MRKASERSGKNVIVGANALVSLVNRWVITIIYFYFWIVSESDPNRSIATNFDGSTTESSLINFS